MKQKIMGILLIFLVLYSTVLPVYAGSGSSAIISIDSQTAGSDVSRIAFVVEKTNTEIQTEFGWDPTMVPIVWESGTNCYNLSVDLKLYNSLSQKDRQKFLKIALSNVQNSSISVTNRNKVYNFFYNIDSAVAGYVRQLDDDVKVDFYRAYNLYLRPFTSTIGTILGVITIVLFISLTFSILFDLSFLIIPALQWILVRSVKEESKKPILISREAWEAYKISTSNTGVKSVLGIYFKSKVIQYIIIGICILYLVSGNIFYLVGLLVDYFRGIINV